MSTLSTYGNVPGLSERHAMLFPENVAEVTKEGPFYKTETPRLVGEQKGDDLQTIWHDTQFKEAVEHLVASRIGGREVKARQLAGVGGYADLPRQVTAQKYANPSWGNFQSIYPGHEMPERGAPWSLSHAHAHGGSLDGGAVISELGQNFGKDLLHARLDQLAKINEAENMGFDTSCLLYTSPSPRD